MPHLRGPVDAWQEPHTQKFDNFFDTLTPPLVEIGDDKEAELD
jgi:hypothetical protein